MRCLRLCLLFVMCFSVATAMPPEQVEVRSGLYKSLAPTEIDYQTYIDANQLLMFVTNRGSFAYDNGAMLGKADGLYYPRGTNLTAIFAAGIWLGGIVDGDLRVSLAEYSHTFGPGPMTGCTFQADHPRFKVYKLLRELKESGFYDDPRPVGDPDLEEKWDDYHNWPVIDGAPVDGAGDPLIIGDQTLWSVFNDADPSAHVNSAGTSQGLGVEVQNTAFACDLPGPLGNTIFMKYILINKGCEDIENMYVSFWADPDLGAANDDFVGCDTTLKLGYCYNATNSDNKYGDDPPAVGFDMLQGPIIPSPGHTALYLGEWQPGFRNLPMTSFMKYINGTDPVNGQETYWYMQGLDAKNSGTYIIDPTTSQVTTFMYPGDPMAGTGWLDCCAHEAYTVPGQFTFLETFGPSGTPVIPPDNVWWSWNSTHNFYCSSDDGPNANRLNWRGHAEEDTWEIRFTSGGSEYYEWMTDEKFPDRAPFEVWNLSGGSDGNFTDTRIQFTVIDDDESGGWTPGDRTYFVEREYYEPLPHYMEYTWDDDFRIGRICINSGVPDEGTVIEITAALSDTVWDTLTSDCRYMLSAGPFDMEPEDTQEVWMAVIVGQGSDRLSSVTEFKFNDVAIQRIFESQYQIPQRLTVCEARVTTQPAVLHRPGLDKTAPLPPEPDIIPYSLHINITSCEPVELAVGDSARVYVDANGNGVIDPDEQCPAAITAIGGAFARDITVCAIPEDELTLSNTRVAIYAIAGKTIVDDGGNPIDYLRAYAPALYEGEWHNLAAGEQVPDVYCLEVNYPNPFNATTKISYALAETGPVTLTIHDILGRQIRTLVNEFKPAGRHEAIWDGTDMHGNSVASGIYFYKLIAGGFVETKKMVLMK